jgi:hypothetical protein
VTSLWEAWNQRSDDAPGDKAKTGLPEAWAGFASRREVLEVHARRWSERLAGQGDLAAELVDFADKVL